MNSTYANNPDHQLHRLKQEVLDLAREEVLAAWDTGLIEDENMPFMREIICGVVADSVIMALIPFLAPHCWEDQPDQENTNAR